MIVDYPAVLKVFSNSFLFTAIGVAANLGPYTTAAI